MKIYVILSILTGVHKILFLCILSEKEFLTDIIHKMTVKDTLIAFFFIASVLLVIFGGWNYMKGRINQFEETVKAEKLATQGYRAEEALQKIRKSKTNSLIMFAAGVTGLFLIITHASRRRNQLNTSIKQKIKRNQL